MLSFVASAAGLKFDSVGVLGVSCPLDADFVERWDQMEATEPVSEGSVTKSMPKLPPCPVRDWVFLRIKHQKLLWCCVTPGSAGRTDELDDL